MIKFLSKRHNFDVSITNLDIIVVIIYLLMMVFLLIIEYPFAVPTALLCIAGYSTLTYFLDKEQHP